MGSEMARNGRSEYIWIGRYSDPGSAVFGVPETRLRVVVYDECHVAEVGGHDITNLADIFGVFERTGHPMLAVSGEPHDGTTRCVGICARASPKNRFWYR
jgi:hypothetical protein